MRLIDADKADVERINCFYGSECRLTDVQEWLDEQPTVKLNVPIATTKTNADRIRAMTDDELADFFYGSPEEEFGICYYCKNFGGAGSPEPCKTSHGCCDVEDKNEAFKKWLKQPITCEF